MTSSPEKPDADNSKNDQSTQWSTHGLDHQQVAEDKMKVGGHTPLLLCNSFWCHLCQRPSEHCGPFSCTSPYIWYLKIRREELNATELPDSITRWWACSIQPKPDVLRHQNSQRKRGTKAIVDSGADATSYPNYVIERLDHLATNHRPVENQIQIIYWNGESVSIDRMVIHGLFDIFIKPDHCGAQDAMKQLYKLPRLAKPSRFRYSKYFRALLSAGRSVPQLTHVRSGRLRFIPWTVLTRVLRLHKRMGMHPRTSCAWSWSPRMINPYGAIRRSPPRRS